jgi:hypothetical protein
LFERSAFVVEDGAAGADPAGVAVGLLDGEDEISIGVALGGVAGLALELRHGEAAPAVV